MMCFKSAPLRAGLSTGLSCCLLLCASSGCNKSGPKRDMVQVTGRITKADGTPLTHGKVMFVSDTKGKPDPMAVTAGAYIDEKSGIFRPETWEANDGVPPGEYMVSINIWGMNIPPPTAKGLEIPIRYVNATKNELRVTVVAGQETQEVNLQLGPEK